MTFRSPTVTTAAGETSEPVPAVVGTAISRILCAWSGYWVTRLRASRKGSELAHRQLGLSWKSRIAFAASRTEPPPTARIASGSNWEIASTPARICSSVGSGWISENV